MATNLSGTHLLHADEGFPGHEVSPSISVTTTFRRDAPFEDLDIIAPGSRGNQHNYSRYSHDVSDRVVAVLNKITNGHSITYSSGLAAAFSALIHYKPRRIAIRGGYMGCHGSIKVYSKTRFDDTPVVDLDDDFKEGDLCWLETPLNPTGESRDIKYYADKIHAVGGKLLVDSTFGPPPLQDPFKWGADCVFHSGTKYFGGHSDLLCGVLVVKSEAECKELWQDRVYMGNVMGSMESWLLLRSLRTLHLRVPRQSENSTALAQWLSKAVNVPAGQEHDGLPGGILTHIWHSSLQGVDERGFDPAKQMEGGFNATFSVVVSKPEYAERLPNYLHYFVNATSLGGVESLIEQRCLSDPSEDPLRIRISVGVEDIEDLKNDMRQAFQKLAKLQV